MTDEKLRWLMEDLEMAVSDFLQDPALNEIKLQRARKALRDYASRPCPKCQSGTGAQP